MPEMTEIHCITSEVTRRAANIQRLIDKLRAMPEESLDNFDSALLSVNLEIAADALKTVEEMAAYLSRPIVETSRLWKNGSGLYETTSGRGFSAGSSIEVLVPDKCRENSSHWERTRLQHDGKDYYLAGYPDLPLAGLAVRVRLGDQP